MKQLRKVAFLCMFMLTICSGIGMAAMEPGHMHMHMYKHMHSKASMPGSHLSSLADTLHLTADQRYTFNSLLSTLEHGMKEAHEKMEGEVKLFLSDDQYQILRSIMKKQYGTQQKREELFSSEGLDRFIQGISKELLLTARQEAMLRHSAQKFIGVTNSLRGQFFSKLRGILTHRQMMTLDKTMHARMMEKHKMTETHEMMKIEKTKEY